MSRIWTVKTGHIPDIDKWCAEYGQWKLALFWTSIIDVRNKDNDTQNKDSDAHNMDNDVRNMDNDVWNMDSDVRNMDRKY